MRALGVSRTSLVPGGVLAGPWVRNELWRRARAVPTLDLRFANNKSLTDSVTGASLVTFNRASSGTYVDSAGVIQTAATDVPRFDHNPTTLESLGLLVEEARTNLLLRSEEFNDAIWTKIRCSVTANATTSPSGAVTADKIVEDTSTNSHIIQLQGSVAVNSGTTYTYSWYFKKAERTAIRVAFGADGGAFAGQTLDLDLTTGSLTNVSEFSIAPAAVSLGNDWWRLSATVPALASIVPVIRGFLIAGGLTNYTGDGTSGLFVWGAQLEAGAFPTSYIPTTTAAVTRSADVASITGTAFSSWYKAGGGSIFTQSRRPVGVNNNGSIFAISDGSFNNLFRLRQDSDNISVTLLGVTSGVSDAAVSVTTGVAGSGLNAASSIAVNNYQLASRGVLGTPDTSVAVATVDRLEIGSVLGAGTAYYNGAIARFCYWSAPLPGSTLQQITQ